MPRATILLIISGSIAAYKSLELIRRLKERGMEVRCILTQGGAQFITPLSVASLSGQPVYDDLFSLKDEVEMGHIRLTREADLVVVAPASADFIAKMAHGAADDLASAALLASTAPVVVVPAMNTQMWSHPATRRNLAQIHKDGAIIVEPGAGMLACGETGAGRMAEVETIIAAMEARLGDVAGASALRGKKALVTSGPTHEPIDPVRYLGNRSSGRQGHAIAQALAAMGAEVTLVSGPVALPDPYGVRVVNVTTAQEMLEACEKALPVDIAVCAAAVADWRAQSVSAHKLKKHPGQPVAPLALTENPDILSHMGKHMQRPELVIGFAAETDDVVAHASQKRQAKQCDWIVANDVSGGKGFEAEENQVVLISAQGEEVWPLLPKSEIACRLAQRIAAHFQGGI